MKSNNTKLFSVIASACRVSQSLSPTAHRRAPAGLASLKTDQHLIAPTSVNYVVNVADGWAAGGADPPPLLSHLPHLPLPTHCAFPLPHTLPSPLWPPPTRSTASKLRLEIEFD